MHIDQGVLALEQLVTDLTTIQKEKKFTIEEIKRIRKEMLVVVRQCLDPMIGHMPRKRHY